MNVARKAEMNNATGRRKHSVARVRIIPGNGNITINKDQLMNTLVGSAENHRTSAFSTYQHRR